MMGITADQMIRLLKLLPYSEGGHYAEVFRSSLTVASPVHVGGRAASICYER
jgi:predicted cupin superfamily sugar epimerase